ncbi:MAG: fimbrial protein [Desulfuromonas sp.]|nr:fimbrial protein [Desulfuromonas sp.]
MIRINLLPVKAAQKKEKLKGQLFAALAAVIVTLVLCALAYMQLLNWVREAKDSVEQKKNEIVQLNKTIGEVDAFKKRQADLQGKLDVLDKLEKSRLGPVLILDELYKALPEKLWLEGFKESGGKITLAGVATNEETVAVFMRNLEISNLFAQVALGGVQQMDKDGVKLHKFDLTCQVEAPQGAAAAPAAGSPKQ